MLNEGQAQRVSVRQSIHEGASFDGTYALMNALAAVVASYGLLADSVAVVIGAMVIATLLGPITGIALALVDGDLVLLRKAVLAEIGGVAIVLGLAFVLGKVHGQIPLGREILSRTRPNILDLMIALAGGAAGAYAVVSPRVSAGLVGVAIATALVPPLASCAICLAHGYPSLALGAFLLFLANLVAIQFSSSAVMVLLGYHRIVGGRADLLRLLPRNSVSGLALIALAVGLSINFDHSLAEQRFERKVHQQLERSLEKYPGAFLADTRISFTNKKTLVIAVVRCSYSLVPAKVAAMQARLPRRRGKPVELHVRTVLTKETTAERYLFEAPSGPEMPAQAGTE